jgi:hypothetical protein
MFNDLDQYTSNQPNYSLSRIPMFNRQDLSNKSFYKTTYGNSYIKKDNVKNNPYNLKFLRETPYDESKIFHRKKDNLENLGKLDKLEDPYRRRDFRRKDFLTMDPKGHLSTYGRPVLPATTESSDAYNNMLYNRVPIYKKSEEKLNNMKLMSNSYPSYNSNFSNNNKNMSVNAAPSYATPRNYDYEPNNLMAPQNDHRRTFFYISLCLSIYF